MSLKLYDGVACGRVNDVHGSYLERHPERKTEYGGIETY